MQITPHDPGGKVRHSIGNGIRGAATFSECGRYRSTLERELLVRPVNHLRGTALWIGMNPSTADAEVNDPTCLREQAYTFNQLGLTRYLKMNVMDYRATHPKDLLRPGVIPAREENLRDIVQYARGTNTVIAAWGALPKRLRHYADDVERALAGEGIKLHCLGYTKDGSPRHPLYLRKDAPLVFYPRP